MGCAGEVCKLHPQLEYHTRDWGLIEKALYFSLGVAVPDGRSYYHDLQRRSPLVLSLFSLCLCLTQWTLFHQFASLAKTTSDRCVARS